MNGDRLNFTRSEIQSLSLRNHACDRRQKKSKVKGLQHSLNGKKNNYHLHLGSPRGSVFAVNGYYVVGKHLQKHYIRTIQKH